MIRPILITIAASLFVGWLSVEIMTQIAYVKVNHAEEIR